MVGVGTNVTARKHMEEMLRQSAWELEEAHRRKDEFLAMLAHELRNPLAPICNALELLERCGTESAALDQVLTPRRDTMRLVWGKSLRRRVISPVRTLRGGEIPKPPRAEGCT